jgi:hypothetical protein
MPSVRPAIKSALLLSIIASGAAFYFDRNPIPEFLFKINSILSAFIFLASAGALGMWTLEKLSLPRLSALEKLLFSMAAGLGLWSFISVLLGLLKLWIPAVVWAIAFFSMFLSVPLLRTFREWLRGLHHMGWSALAIGGFLTAFALSFLLALAPITYYDSLVYHLALPAAYVQSGHWLGLRHMVYSAFPQNLEMLWTIGLLLGNDIVVNLIAWSLSVMLVLSAAAFAGRFYDRSAARLAAIILALMPAVLLLSSGGYVETGLALYGFLALYAAILFIENGHTGFLCLSGALAGWTMGIKYTGLIPAVLTGGIIAFLSREKKARALSLYAGMALIFFLPWLVKNWIYVGNPVFPFFHEWGVKSRNPWLDQAAAGYFKALTEYHPRSFLNLISLVWEIPLKTLGFGGGFDVLGDLGWTPFIWFLPALWLCGSLPKTIKVLLSYACLFVIPWGMSRPVLRFLMPVLPVLGILTAYAWTNGIERQNIVFRWTGRILLGSFILSGLFLFFWVTQTTEPFAVAMGLETRHHYLARKLTYFGAAGFINENTPANASVLLVGDQRSFYYKRRIFVSPVFSQSPLVLWANSAENAENLKQILKERGFTHVVVNRAEMRRLSSYSILPFDEKGSRNWESLQKSLKPEYADSFCDVFEL